MPMRVRKAVLTRKCTCWPGALTIWMEFSVDFLDKWNCTFSHEENGTDWAVSFDSEFRMQGFSRAITRSKARIVKAKAKHKYRRPKLKSFSPWVLQLCCEKSVNSSREKKNSCQVMNGLEQQRFVTWIRRLGHCCLLGNSVALVIVDT